MSVAEVAVPKPKAKIPSLNPYLAPNCVCSNRNCNTVMTPQIGKEKRGGDIVVFYNCPNCHYDMKVSLQHANGECVSEGSLDRVDSLKEVFEK